MSDLQRVHDMLSAIDDIRLESYKETGFSPNGIYVGRKAYRALKQFSAEICSYNNTDTHQQKDIMYRGIVIIESTYLREWEIFPKPAMTAPMTITTTKGDY